MNIFKERKKIAFRLNSSTITTMTSNTAQRCTTATNNWCAPRAFPSIISLIIIDNRWGRASVVISILTDCAF